jgi:transketolase
VGNSTFTELSAQQHPERAFQVYIAEQPLVAAAVGLQVRGWMPFAAFLALVCDFIRMAAVSGADIRLVGSHSGVSIGEDGPSQMALEDIAARRSVHGSTVLYHCCANQTAKPVAAMVDRPGIVYLRTTRAAAPVIYDAEERFAIGGSRVLHSSENGAITVVGTGITVHEALAAADELEREDIAVQVIDLYSIKPIDEQTLIDAAEATGAVITVEDHHPEGGLGGAVLEALSATASRSRIEPLAVRNMPTSGTPAQLLSQAVIDRQAIAETVRQLIPARAASA